LGNGHCKGCPARRPYRIPHDGVSTWTVNISAIGKPGCESLTLEIVAQLRTECEVTSETMAEVVSKLLAWRTFSDRK
jgi:hypothetical protein